MGDLLYLSFEMADVTLSWLSNFFSSFLASHTAFQIPEKSCCWAFSEYNPNTVFWVVFPGLIYVTQMLI